jgi:hypothetical protein
MAKAWIRKALDLLEDSLSPIPPELNELDWKEKLSPSNTKLTRHLAAFSNLPGGGYIEPGDSKENQTGESEPDFPSPPVFGLCHSLYFPP